MEHLLNILKSFIEPGAIVLIIVLVLLVNSWIFKKIKSEKTSRNVIKNSIAAFFVFTGIIAFVLTIPIDKALKGQILSFLAIIVSAGIALS